MRRGGSIRLRAIVASALAGGALVLAACGGNGDGGGNGGSTGAGATGGNPTFSSPTEITNPYSPISKFHRCVLAGNEGGTQIRVVRTLLDRTKTFHYRGQTIDAVVQEDRETEDGALVERTFDYFAQSDSGDVYYLGEDVNTYENGKVTGHGGEWLLGRQTDTPGVLMPANPELGDTWKSEDVPRSQGAPGIHEADRVAAAGKTARIAGRTYKDVIRVREDTKPPPETEYKLYSRGTGVIDEENGALQIVSCS
jgi:hypothetical protein